MDGFAFLEHIEQAGKPLESPIVVLTAKTMTEDERSFLIERTMLVLSKSVHPLGSLGRALAMIASRGGASANTETGSPSSA
jgi:CheY-like chemotaxis protein